MVLPSRKDPRLRVSAVILTLQVLGQTTLGFKVSIAQIVITIGLCGVIEAAVTLWRQRMLVWPASAVLTGNGVSFILRATGTRHGDWWSVRGIHYFAAAGVFGLLTKYLIRPGGRHVFNPSNVALVLCFLVAGPLRVFPQPLWWGPFGLGVASAVVVIAAGAVWVLRAVRMVPMVVWFLVTFDLLVLGLAVVGRSFSASWHVGAISGREYWADLCLSPELFVFACFMISDPQTTPQSRRGRVVFGVVTAVVAAVLIAPQQTEYGIKVAILASLTVACAVARATHRVRRPDRPPAARRVGRVAVVSPAIVSVVIAVGAPIDTARLAGNQQLLAIERGTGPPRFAQ